MSARDEKDDEWDEAQEPSFGRFDEVTDILAALVMGGVLGGMFYTFGF